MNILRFLIPKKHTAYIHADDTLRQVLEKFDYHGYTAVPIIDRDGKYLSTITEGDLLREIKKNIYLNIKQTQNISIRAIESRRQYHAISINTVMDDLVQQALSQNFVPVLDDRGVFIGIITRRAIIEYCYQSHCKANPQSTDTGAAPNQEFLAPCNLEPCKLEQCSLR